MDWTGTKLGELAGNFRLQFLGCARRDPVDHGAGERDIPIHPCGKIILADSLKIGPQTCLKHMSIAADIVTAHDSQRTATGSVPAAETPCKIAVDGLGRPA